MKSRQLRLPALCMITDGSTELSFTRVESALAGGVTMVQLRCSPEVDPQSIVRAGRRLRQLTKEADAVLIVNDHVELVELIGADGVHVGQRDTPPLEARSMLGDGRIIGYSVDNVSQLDRAVCEAADYIGAGPVFHTFSKRDAADPIGLDGLRSIAAVSPLPVIAIGGITESNVCDVMRCGAAGIATISMLAVAEDASVVCRRVLDALDTRIQ